MPTYTDPTIVLFSCICCSFLWQCVVFLRGRESLQVLFTVYICIDLEDQIIKRGVGIPLTCHIFVPISSQDLIFHQHMSWSLLFQYHFVDISGIVDITIQTFNNLVVWFPWLMVPKNHLLQYYSDYYTRLLLNKQRGS